MKLAKSGSKLKKCLLVVQEERTVHEGIKVEVKMPGINGRMKRDTSSKKLQRGMVECSKDQRWDFEREEFGDK